jgi:hypothetical protein
MAYTLTQFKSKVSEIVQDDAVKLSTSERDNFIQEAVKIYSKHRPSEVVREIAGDGTYDYAIADLKAWVKGFSIIKQIEYPANQRDPEYVDEDDFMIIEKATGQFLRFLEDSPSAAEIIRVIYTALHILIDAVVTVSIATPAVVSYAAHGLNPGDAIKFSTTGALPTGITAGIIYYVIAAGLTSNAFEISATPGGAAINTSGTQSGAHTLQMNTIPAIDEDAVANLAASLCSGALASAYAQTSDSTITADSVDHRSKSQEFTSRAKMQKQNYLDHLGLKEGNVAPASAVGDMDVKYPWGEERLTHPRKGR